ncbi:MAG: DUF5689 domain-containing protein [Paludibacter sp.]|nr:DUF5689 domain-containing protein [Paludibacter sp.]
MNHIMQNTQNWKTFFLIVAATIMTSVLVTSCEDENPNPIGGSDVAFGLTNKNSEGLEFDIAMPADYVCTFDQKGGTQYFYMESNIGKWTLSPGEGHEKWVDIWPAEGKDDGRFGIKATPNPSAYPRDYTINVLNSRGKIMGSFPVYQDPSAPALAINYSSTPKFVASIGETFIVKVTANIAWQATTNDSWITVGEATDSTQSIVIAQNPAVQREGSITFSMIGVDQSVVLYVKQLDLANDFANATKVTITDLMSRINASGIGTIDDNLYVEGYVISDRSKQALSKNQIVVQDESNKGVWLEFTNAEDNTYNLNDKVKIHMYGASFVLDASSKASKVESFSPSFVHDATPSSGITPIEITNLVNLNQYENVLVTLKEVEFPLPFGTYVNIVETQYNKKPANWTATAEPFADDTDNYGHLVRDKQGNIMKMYTSPSFLERFKIVMPWGSGSLTGIIMKRIKNNTPSYFIRIRSNDDNKVSANKATALSRDIMQLGPWPISTVALSSITATVGSGTLKYTGRVNQNVSVTSTPEAFYYVASQARMEPCEINPNGTPVIPYNNSISFTGINTQYWWGNPSSSISGGSSGEAWVITTSTLNATGSGSLYLQFASSSSTSGPAHFTIEWAEAENTPFNQWNHVANFTVCDINNSQHLMQYAYKLPDAVKGKANLVIRLRVNSQERATLNGSSIGTSGTNRLGFVRITQLKN